MASDPYAELGEPVSDGSTPATPTSVAASPAPADPYAALGTSVEGQPQAAPKDDPYASLGTAVNSTVDNTEDPYSSLGTPVTSDRDNYIAQERQEEQSSVPDKILNTGKGIAEGLWNFATDTVPGIVKGAYGLATADDLTPGQKMLAAGNTALANLATLPYLAKNAVQGAQNIYSRNFGSGITDDEYGQQWDELQRQNLTRRAFLNNGLQTALGYNDGPASTYMGLPASAEKFQDQLAPLLDVTNAIPFAGGALAKLGRAATVDAGTAAARQLIPSIGRRVASSALDKGAAVTDVGANLLDTIRHAPQKGLEAIGLPPEAAEKMAGAPLHLLAGAAGGAEMILPVLAGEAAPSLLRQFSMVQRAASNAVLTGESTASFVQRLAQGTTGFTRTILNALDQTGLAKVMGTVGDVVGSGIKGGILNPFTPLQFLSSDTSEGFGQQLGQNVGFGAAGAAAAHGIVGEGPAEVAMRNYNDVVQFAGRLSKESGSDEQLNNFNSLPHQAQVAVAQFANTRPDVDVVLKPGGDNLAYLDPSTGRRTVALNTSNPAQVVAHIAAHEYVHTLLMVGGTRAKVLSGLMGNPELGTEGLLGRTVEGNFVPSPQFRDFTDQYVQALQKDGATVNAKGDNNFYRQMAEEFYTESMASRFAGTNAKGETGMSRLYRTGDMVSRAVDSTLGRSGPAVIDYLDRKYAQGRIAPRFGADALEKSIKQGPGGSILTGLQALGVEGLRRNETMSNQKPEYTGPSETEHVVGLNELRANPQAAAKLFGASSDLIFAPDGTIQQRTRAQANRAARDQGKIWFDTLSKQDPSKLPPGALRAVTRTDAKGQAMTELEGKFLTDGQVDALVKANALNRYQEGALRQVNRALQAQDGNVYHVIYQTASNGKGRYATLASSARDMVVRQIRVTKDHNVILDSFDVDQFLTNYDRALHAAQSTGRAFPLKNPEIALRDYLSNQALGYTGAGQPLDAASPPTQPPARVFPAAEANAVNELLGVSTKDNAGVNPRFGELEEAGQDRSRTTFKSFRLDRINSLEALQDKLPVDYYRVKYNRSPNAGQDEGDEVRSGNGSQSPSAEGIRVHPTAAPGVPAQPADRQGARVSGGENPDAGRQGGQLVPPGHDDQVPRGQGQGEPDRSPQGSAGGEPGPQDARLVGSPGADREPVPFTDHEPTNALLNYWVKAGGDSDSFRFGQPSSQKSFQGVATDLSRDTGVSVHVIADPLYHTIITKDGTGKEGVYVVEKAPDGRPNTYRIHAEAGNNAGGSLVYQIIGNWAANNGKVLVPDRGLSNVNILRRSENMISSVLRNKSADSWEPHPLQEVDWRKGDTAHNLESLLRRTTDRTLEVAPFLKDWTFNARFGMFIDPEGNTYRPNSPELNERLKHDLDSTTYQQAPLPENLHQYTLTDDPEGRVNFGPVERRPAHEYGVGVSTAQRAIITQSLISKREGNNSRDAVRSDVIPNLLYSPNEDYRLKAEAAGYDTSRVYYHGTTALRNFKTFRPGNGELGHGIYVTSDPFYAGTWAGGQGGRENGRMIPLYLKKGDIFDGTSTGRYVKSSQMPDGYFDIAQRLKRLHPDLYKGYDDVMLARHIQSTQGELNRWLQKAGYVGAKNEASQIPGQVVVFDPSSLKSSIGNRGTFDSSKRNMLYSPNGFYSQLERTLEEKMPNRASAGQLLGLIRGAGIKQDELKWSGLEDWLRFNPNPTKEQVLQHLQTEGRMQIDEHILSDAHGIGDKTPEEWIEESRRLERVAQQWQRNGDEHQAEIHFARAEEAGRNAEGIDPESGGTKGMPKYNQYQLPGGANYREQVFSLPMRTDSSPLFTEWMKSRGYPDSEKAIRVGEYQKEFPPRDKTSYTSSHFPDVPNYVAHMRLNDRVDAQGRPGTLIEEMQSDRHQEGRSKGYKGDVPKIDELPHGFKVALEKVPQYDEPGWVVRDSDGYAIGAASKSKEGAINQALSQMYGQATDGTVPDAPFRKTWHEFLFRKALADAVATGKDWLGWTTGDTQAERYDLSKQVKSIKWYKNSNGTYDLDAVTPDDATQRELAVKVDPEKLSDYIGKEPAKKVISASEKDLKGELSGVDLKVGGEGMKGFYDSILPQYVAKYVRRFGGSVDRTDISAGSTSRRELVEHPDGRHSYRNVDEFTKTPIWRVEITPAMRESIARGGQALFSPNSSSTPPANTRRSAPSATTPLLRYGGPAQKRKEPVAG